MVFLDVTLCRFGRHLEKPIHQTTWHHSPADHNLYHCANLRSEQQVVLSESAYETSLAVLLVRHKEISKIATYVLFSFPLTPVYRYILNLYNSL